MIPLMDFGDIAIIIPHIVAVGKIAALKGSKGFDVYLSGKNDPIFLGFKNNKDAEIARDDLLSMIADYYVEPDFEDFFGDEEIDEENGDGSDDPH